MVCFRLYIYRKKQFFLLEDEYNDDGSYIIVDENRKVIMNDVWNGFDDFHNNIHSLKNVQDFYEFVSDFENSYNSSALKKYTATNWLPAYTSIEDMRLYGYTNMQIVPFRPKDMLKDMSPTALEEYLRFCKPYILNANNTEREVSVEYLKNLSEKELNSDMLFGFKTTEWLNYYNYRKIMDGIENNSAKVEEDFLESSYSFVIYQLIQDSENRDYSFMSMAGLEKANLSISRDNYNAVYSDDLTIDAEDVNVTLNNLYTKFNLDLPKDFHGHSLSVSDIIGINIDNNITFHYVDSFGFKEIENFVEIRDKTYDLDKVEISNLIDNFLVAKNFEVVLPKALSEIYDIFTSDISQSGKLECIRKTYSNIDSSYLTEYGDYLDVIQSRDDGLYFERSGQPFTISYEEIVNHIDVLIDEDRYPHKAISIEEAQDILSDTEELLKLKEEIESENTIEIDTTISMIDIDNISESCDFLIHSGAGKNFTERKFEIYKLYEENKDSDIIAEHLEIIYSQVIQENSINFDDVGIKLKYENSMLIFTLNNIAVNMNFSDLEKKICNMISEYSYLSESEFKQYEERNDDVQNAKTGEIVTTPRGSFSVVDMTQAKLEELGYEIQHISVGNKHLIMCNGQHTVAIKKEKTSILEQIKNNKAER